MITPAKLFFILSFSVLIGFLSSYKIYFGFLFLYLLIFERRIFYLSLCFVALALGYFYGYSIISQKPEPPFYIFDYPQNFGNFQKISVKDKRGNIYYVFLSMEKEVKPGQVIILNGKYDAQRRTFFFPELEVLSQRKTILSFLNKFKERSEGNIKRYLPFPEENILRGIVLGSEIEDPDFRKKFQKSGLSHLTAVSGYNLTLITSLISQALTYFSFLTPTLIFILSILISIIFLFLMGFKATVLRAVILGILVLLVKKIGKIPLRMNLLLLVFIILLFIQPETVLFDVAFHLSFLSLFAIFYLVDLLPEKLPRFLKETISAQFLVLPYLLSFSGFINPFSIFANALILPLVPFLMILGLLSLVLPQISFLSLPLLLFFRKIVEIFGNLGFYFYLPSFLIFLFYFVCGLIFLIKRKDVEIDLAFLSR
jgi:ComEC/Rec2-related protein